MFSDFTVFTNVTCFVRFFFNCLLHVFVRLFEDVLSQKIAFRRKHRVIDLTSARVLAKGLEEAKIECMKDEKVTLSFFALLHLQLRNVI